MIHLHRMAALSFAWLGFAALGFAAPDIFPLKDVRAGQHGVGRTVFSGTRVEEFQVEVLGVLENLGPRQSIILARLSGGPLVSTGVMQGMSGSPVYIDGKLVGAVALSFPLSKEAIAGIRPIEDMLRVRPQPAQTIAKAAPRRQPFVAGGNTLEEIATPVSFTGFTPAALEHFAPQLRQMGLDPRQGVSGGGAIPARLGDPRKLQPGSMISVQLISGDMTVGAEGTITAIDGDRIYAFGHRFLDEGSTDLPFASAEVLALLPNLSSSFKISIAREWMGSITSDRETAVSGLTGRQASLIPVQIRVGQNTYRMQLVQDRVMTPLLMQMALFSAIDSTERSVGAQAYSVRGQLDFDGGPVRVDDVYSGDVGVAVIASAGIGSPIAYALQSGFDALKLKTVSLDIAPVERRSQEQVVDLMAARTVRPGEDLDLTVVMEGQNGVDISRRVQYRVPVGTPVGILNFTIADATSTNVIEFQAAVATPQRSPQQVLGLLNGLRSNTKAYIRVWRAEPSFTVDGRDIPDPPPSLAMLLSRVQAGSTNLVNTRGAKVAELEVPGAPGFVVTGTKTIQVEVKE
ncbi:MAG TPA: SpoIVB peptidase S55 domain-containing protein [Bryobacteraceae bacterium]|nr:SpoIVB peptidase S55 domain-containing protein [Bryobacteraceae bacterium]